MQVLLLGNFRFKIKKIYSVNYVFTLMLFITTVIQSFFIILCRDMTLLWHHSWWWCTRFLKFKHFYLTILVLQFCVENLMKRCIFVETVKTKMFGLIYQWLSQSPKNYRKVAKYWSLDLQLLEYEDGWMREFYVTFAWVRPNMQIGMYMRDSIHWRFWGGGGGETCP